MCQGWDQQRKIDPDLILKTLSDSLVISGDDMQTECFTSNFFHRFCHILLMNYFVIISPGWEYPLEMRKATQPSILAWRIPWTVHGVGKSPTQLSDFHFHFVIICPGILKFSPKSSIFETLSDNFNIYKFSASQENMQFLFELTFFLKYHLYAK